MHRLAVRQPVVLDLGEETLDCLVASVDGDEAVLTPLLAADAAYIPSLGRSATLVFESGRSWARIPGAVRRADDDAHLVFANDHSGDLPRRRQVVRVGISLHVSLTPITTAGAVLDEAHDLLTTDVSLGGLGVRLGRWPLADGALVSFVLALPSAPAATGTGRIVRLTEEIAGIELVDVSREDRVRLAAFLLANSTTLRRS